MHQNVVIPSKTDFRHHVGALVIMFNVRPPGGFSLTGIRTRDYDEDEV